MEQMQDGSSTSKENGGHITLLKKGGKHTYGEPYYLPISTSYPYLDVRRRPIAEVAQGAASVAQYLRIYRPQEPVDTRHHLCARPKQKHRRERSSSIAKLLR